jgi:DNA polymerase-3 subunit beta
MIIHIEQETFSSLLTRAQSVLERKSTRPILENVLLEAFEDKIRLSATDLRVSLTQETNCRVERPGSTAIPGRKLHEIVREIPKQVVTLETQENQWVTVSAKKSVFHLPGAPAEEYPELPSPPEAFLVVDSSVFRDMLDKTLFATSNDETRMYLCGVLTKEWTDDDGTDYLCMVATDGHRLSKIDRPLSQRLGVFQEGIIIPKKGLAELRNLLEDVDRPFEMSSAEGRVFARFEGTVLAVTLIDESFPNYEQVVPTDAPHILRISRSGLVDALRRVSLLSDLETHSVLLEANSEGSVLSSTNAPFGDAREEVEAIHEGEPFKLAFNAAYVLEALRVIGGDTVTLAVNDPLAPCLLRSESDSGHLCVIMPMRID